MSSMFFDIFGKKDSERPIQTNFAPEFSENNASGCQTPPPKLVLKCPECSISKSTYEELEIHAKMEHLNWLPFECQFCHTTRVNDVQMREHLFSSHKHNDSKYLYVDNSEAKEKLTKLMDEALIMAKMEVKTEKVIAPEILAQNVPSLDESNLDLSHLFQNELFAAELLANYNRIATIVQKESNFNNLQNQIKIPRVRYQNIPKVVVAKTQSVQKDVKQKRSGFQCPRCLRTVSCAARSNHVYFHLGKDQNEYRFVCLFAGCTTKHYRKDQMDTHQTKAHGYVNQDLMENRTMILADRFENLQRTLFEDNFRSFKGHVSENEPTRKKLRLNVEHLNSTDSNELGQILGFDELHDEQSTEKCTNQTNEAHSNVDFCYMKKEELIL